MHYKSKDGRSEPTKKEITELENIQRLTEDLKAFEIIITFGNNANFAVNQCKDKLENPKVIGVRRLGLQSLNQIKVDIDGKDISNSNNDKNTGNLNTLRRLKVVAKEIVDQLI